MCGPTFRSIDFYASSLSFKNRVPIRIRCGGPEIKKLVSILMGIGCVLCTLCIMPSHQIQIGDYLRNSQPSLNFRWRFDMYTTPFLSDDPVLRHKPVAAMLVTSPYKNTDMASYLYTSRKKRKSAH